MYDEDLDFRVFKCKDYSTYQFEPVASSSPSFFVPVSSILPLTTNLPMSSKLSPPSTDYNNENVKKRGPRGPYKK